MFHGAESRVIRGWALLDLCVTAPFALPVTAILVLRLLYVINGALGGGGVMPAFDAVHLLFVSLFGALGVVWALARLLQPVRELGLVDGFARLAVAALLAWAVLGRGAPVVLLAFVLTEVAGALHQLYALRRPARSARW